MNFDIEEVKRQSMDNPVYYVQYGTPASRRSCAGRAGGVVLRPIEDADLALLATEAELDLRGPRRAARPDRDGRRAARAAQLTHAAQDLAARFHRFYTECRVLSDDAALTQARLWLSRGDEAVLATLLDLVGVSAPESMERLDGSELDGSNG